MITERLNGCGTEYGSEWVSGECGVVRMLMRAGEL